MRVVLQRVLRAEVRVNKTVIGSIGRGLLLLVAIHHEDGQETLEWMCNKILKLRVFPDEQDKMNRSVQDISGSLLVVSQFTLYGDARKGTRPSYIESAPPQLAENLYDKMVSYFRKNSNLEVETGEFAAMMEVELVNDGPVTLILER